MKNKPFRLSSFQLISLGFFGVILLGSLLLCLPIACQSGTWTPWINALFTSTSAVCVTGLIVYDTALYWSLFGQIVILLLIQIGGMGVVTLVASFFMLSGKKIGLSTRGTLQDAISSHEIGGIIRFVGFALKGFFVVEACGALLMMPVFVSDFGPKGIWMAVFHSVSAFCNAGFDIMGTASGAFSSLTAYAANPVINLTVCLLIIIGGIGFVVWQDMFKHKFRIRKYKLQSKVVLLVTFFLILLPTVYFFFFEFQALSPGERLLASLFQAVTPRTAGFNTVNLAAMSEVGQSLMIILMLIGGSPGSTAGGMKTTTVAVIFAAVWSMFRKKEETELLKRRISDETVKTALSVFVLYFVLFLGGGLLISAIEHIPMMSALYETGSAVGTVGLTLGITPTLQTVSKIILILSMYFGRVGGLTLFYAALGAKKKAIAKHPIEQISVG